MDTTTKRKNVQRIILADLAKLTSEMVSLTGIDRVHGNRLNIIKSTFERVMFNLISAGLYKKEDIIECGKVLSALSNLDPKMEHPRTSEDESVTFIPVKGIIKETNHGATIFSIPGFVGGWYKHSTRGAQRREDNLRSIPSDAILIPYTPESGVVGVESRWIQKPDQRDLRDFMSGKVVTHE